MIIVFILVGVFFLSFLYYDFFIRMPKADKIRKAEEEERKHKEEEEEKRYKKWKIECDAQDEFDVSLGDSDTHEDRNKAYDEIVRLVNLVAMNLAKACVKQDKANREEDLQECELEDLDQAVSALKKSWAFKKK